MNNTGEWQVSYPPRTDEIRRSLQQSAEHPITLLREQGWFSSILEPGDATHYECFVVRRDHRNCWVGFMSGDDRGGSAVLPIEHHLFAGYVKDKMGIENAHSAAILTDFLNVVFGHITATIEDRSFAGGTRD